MADTDETNVKVTVDAPPPDETAPAAPEPDAPPPPDKVSKYKADGELAGAIFRANTCEAGVGYTQSSAHATKVGPGLVRIEIPHEDPAIGRKTLTVQVPDTCAFVIYDA